MKSSGMKEKILMSVSKQPMPIIEIVKKAGVCTTAASKYIYILQAEGKVEVKSFGNMKLVKKR